VANSHGIVESDVSALQIEYAEQDTQQTLGDVSRFVVDPHRRRSKKCG
jgi:hypothetical protein